MSENEDEKSWVAHKLYVTTTLDELKKDMKDIKGLLTAHFIDDAKKTTKYGLVMSGVTFLLATSFSVFIQWYFIKK